MKFCLPKATWLLFFFLSSLTCTCPHQFLAAIVVRDDANDADEDEAFASFRGEPVFNVVGTLSGPTKEKVGNFLLESYTVSVAPANLPAGAQQLFCFWLVGRLHLCSAGFFKPIVLA